MKNRGRQSSPLPSKPPIERIHCAFWLSLIIITESFVLYALGGPLICLYQGRSLTIWADLASVSVSTDSLVEATDALT
jgi:hypothetical protein